jgi:hypothetical protein
MWLFVPGAKQASYNTAYKLKIFNTILHTLKQVWKYFHVM